MYTSIPALWWAHRLPWQLRREVWTPAPRIRRPTEWKFAGETISVSGMCFLFLPLALLAGTLDSWYEQAACVEGSRTWKKRVPSRFFRFWDVLGLLSCHVLFECSSWNTWYVIWLQRPLLNQKCSPFHHSEAALAWRTWWRNLSGNGAGPGLRSIPDWFVYQYCYGWDAPAQRKLWWRALYRHIIYYQLVKLILPVYLLLYFFFLCLPLLLFASRDYPLSWCLVPI